MHLMYFTEQPMSAYPEQAGRDFGATALMFSNKHFDPVAGSRLYHEYLEHYRLAEEVGFDGIMLNEHHNAPFCMQAKCNVFASILAAMTSRVTIVWAARQRYPYIALSTEIEATKRIWQLYDKTAAEVGYEGGPEYRGYLQRLHVAETEEKALANARQFMWMQGEFTGLAHPVWSSPSGYFSPANRTAFVEFAVGRRANPRAAALEDQLRDQQIIAGTPKTVIPKLRRLLEETRPSIVGFWAADGFVSIEDTKTCIRLLGTEVLPALREIGKELGLWSPFEANAPTSINFSEPARLKDPSR